MIDVHFSRMTGTCYFFPMTQAAKEWFQGQVGAVPDEREGYSTDMNTSKDMIRQMVKDGLTVGSATETSRVKATLGIKEPTAEEIEAELERREKKDAAIAAAGVVPVKLDVADSIRLRSLGVLWDPPQ